MLCIDSKKDSIKASEPKTTSLAFQAHTIIKIQQKLVEPEEEMGQLIHEPMGSDTIVAFRLFSKERKDSKHEAILLCIQKWKNP